ncbi:MAG: hypothetical protein WDO71_11895 [Bacteroidota bacterium]
MKQNFSALLCAFVFATLLFSCKKETLEETSKIVPFTGTYTTTVELLSSPPMVQVRITGIGQSSDLGSGKFIAYSTLNLTTAPPFRLGGISTMFAANGDVFYTSFTGTQTPNTDGTNTVVMTHTLRGGTGKYQNASGTFTGNTIVNQSSPANTITLNGTISY